MRTRNVGAAGHDLGPGLRVDALGVPEEPHLVAGDALGEVEAVVGRPVDGLSEKPDEEGVPIARQRAGRLAEYVRFLARNDVTEPTWRERNTAVRALLVHNVYGDQAAQVLAERVVEVPDVHLLEKFGSPEAIWEFEVEDFPVVVTMDSHGGSLHAEIEEKSQAKMKELLGLSG